MVKDPIAIEGLLRNSLETENQLRICFATEAGVSALTDRRVFLAETWRCIGLGVKNSLFSLVIKDFISKSKSKAKDTKLFQGQLQGLV